VVVNKPFICRLCHLYRDWPLPGNCPLTPAENARQLSQALLVQWNKTDWNNISSESIVKWLEKCDVLNNMNGTEDCVLWEEDYEENSSSSDGSVSSD
jgi:hypothetical protein